MLRLLAMMTLCGALLLRAQVFTPLPLDNSDENKEEIGKLLEQALSTTDPNEQIRIYKEVLKLDPANQNAFNGIKEAQQKIENQRREAAEREDKERKDRQKQSDDARTQDQALNDADTALRNGDAEGAQAALDTARKVGRTNPAIAALEMRIRGLQNYQRMLHLAFLAAGAVVIGLIVGLVLAAVGKKKPYLELTDGPGAGKRFAIEKDVVLIGSVEDYGGGKNDVVVSGPDGMISASQCEIHRRRNKYYLVDCDSAYGTTADGQKVTAEQPVLLRNGAKIELAAVRTLRFGMEKKKKG